MRQWPGRLEPLHAAVDAGRLENHNENRERPRPIDFLKVDHLLIVDLADDDPRQFHRDGHGGLSFKRKREQQAYAIILAKQRTTKWQCNGFAPRDCYTSPVFSSPFRQI